MREQHSYPPHPDRFTGSGSEQRVRLDVDTGRRSGKETEFVLQSDTRTSGEMGGWMHVNLDVIKTLGI